MTHAMSRSSICGSPKLSSTLITAWCFDFLGCFDRLALLLQLGVVFPDKIRVAALVEFERRRVGFVEAAIDQLRDARVKQRHIQPPAQQTSIHNAVVPMRAERLG